MSLLLTFMQYKYLNLIISNENMSIIYLNVLKFEQINIKIFFLLFVLKFEDFINTNKCTSA